MRGAMLWLGRGVSVLASDWASTLRRVENAGGASAAFGQQIRFAIADSVPEKEYRETVNKAKALLEAAK